MTYEDITRKLTSGEVPAWVMVGGGIILLLLAMKAFKGLLKTFFVLVAFALLAGAAWWHFHQQH